MISIVMPTHNHPPMLSTTLLSVFAQDFDDYELIVPDVSPDRYFKDELYRLLETDESLQKYADNISKIKIIYPDCNPRLPGAVRMSGVRNAVQDNDMIFFLDHDDFLGNGILKYIPLAMRQYPSTEMISTDYTSFCYFDGEICANLVTHMNGEVCGSSDTIWVENIYFKFPMKQDIYRIKHPWQSASCPKIISKKTLREHRFVFIEDTEVVDDIMWSTMTHSLVETQIPLVGYVYVCYSGYLTNSCDPKNTPSETTIKYADICKQYGSLLDEIHYTKQRNMLMI